MEIKVITQVFESATFNKIMGLNISLIMNF